MKISNEVMRILEKQKWRGNVRELKNVIEHALAITLKNIIESSDLPNYLKGRPKTSIDSTLIDLMHSVFPQAKNTFEKLYVKNLLKQTSGDVAQAATKSKIKRQNLYKKFKKHRISPDEYRNRKENEGD